MSDEKIHPKIQITNKAGETIGVSNLFPALEKQAIRRTVRVFLFDDQGNMLLQKRSPHVVAPNVWDQSVGGHVDEGEDNVRHAAYRELKEELGLSDISLKLVFESHFSHELVDWGATQEFTHVFIGTLHAQEAIDFDTDEVAAIRWESTNNVLNDIKQHPDNYAAGFRSVFPWVCEKLGIGAASVTNE